MDNEIQGSYSGLSTITGVTILAILRQLDCNCTSIVPSGLSSQKHQGLTWAHGEEWRYYVYACLLCIKVHLSVQERRKWSSIPYNGLAGLFQRRILPSHFPPVLPILLYHA